MVESIRFLRSSDVKLGEQPASPMTTTRCSHYVIVKSMEEIGHVVLNKLDVPLSERRFNFSFTTLEHVLIDRQIRLSHTPIQFSRPSSSPRSRTSIFKYLPCLEISFHVWLQWLFERLNLVCWSSASYPDLGTWKSRGRIALLTTACGILLSTPEVPANWFHPFFGV